MYLVQSLNVNCVKSFVQKLVLTALLAFCFLLGSPAKADISDLSGLDLKELEKIILTDESYRRYCSGKTRDWGGFAHIGGSGFACDAKEYGDAELASLIYAGYFVDRGTLVKEYNDARKNDKDWSLEKEKIRYTSKIIGLLETIAREYIKRRRSPNTVSEKEMNAWIRGNLTRIYQETLFSHYRVGATKKLDPTGLRFLVGDATNPKKNTEFLSMGISQINIQAHNDLIPGAAYFDLIRNIMEGYENFYRLWQRARGALRNPKGARGGIAKCATKIKSYEDVVKSAYSAYTGGGFCRWYKSPIRKRTWEQKTGCKFPISKSPKDKVAACKEDFRKTQFKMHWNNDLDFVVKYKTQPWKRYVDDDQKIVSVDTECLFDGNHYCLIPEQNRQAFLRQHILVVPEGPKERQKVLMYCVLEEGEENAHCVKSIETVGCLAPFSKVSHYRGVRPITIRELTKSAEKVTYYNSKYEACNSKQQGIFQPGTVIRPKRRLNIRSNPWVPANKKKSKGNWLRTVVDPSQTYQVLDFVIRPGVHLERWYKIWFKPKKGPWRAGFVYGGKIGDRPTNEWNRQWKIEDPKKISQEAIVLPGQGLSFKIRAPRALSYFHTDLSPMPKSIAALRHYEVLGSSINTEDQVTYTYFVDVANVNGDATPIKMRVGTFRSDEKEATFEADISKNIRVLPAKGSQP